MKTARVVGQVVSTLKHPDFEGRRLLVIEPDEIQGLRAGKASIAVDLIGCEVGERVLVVDDGAAARGLMGRSGPIRCMIVGHVDEVDLGPEPATK